MGSYKNALEFETAHRADRDLVSEIMKSLRDTGKDVSSKLEQTRATVKGRKVTERQRVNYALMSLVPVLRKTGMTSKREVFDLVKGALESDRHAPSELLLQVKDAVVKRPKDGWKKFLENSQEISRLADRQMEDVHIIPSRERLKVEGPDLF